MKNPVCLCALSVYESLWVFSQKASGLGVHVNVHSPSHGNAWVQVVELWGTQCNLFVFFSVSRLDLHLQQLLLTALHCCLLPLHQPDREHTQRQVQWSQTPLVQIRRLIWRSLLMGTLSTLLGKRKGVYFHQYAVWFKQKCFVWIAISSRFNVIKQLNI